MHRFTLPLALCFLFAAACETGPVGPDGAIPDAGLTADSATPPPDATADGPPADASGDADALTEGPAGDDPVPEPGDYQAVEPNGCEIQYLTLTAEGVFETDGALPCDHPIPLGGRYGIVSRRLISYLRLHDKALTRQYPELGTRLYEYRIESGLLYLRADGAPEFFAMERIR
jgi:hypothetical protein